jgi:class 3 adenylate cyclase
MDVMAWLGGLGLEQYAPAFRDNDIDGEILRDLTAEDLVGLGVTSIGHRRKLIAAIAALRESPAVVAVPAAPIEPSGAAAAERRQVTILFCDVVGSTELATRLDPEDLREVLDAYRRCVAEVLARFGGFVAKYMGDGVLAYFGYPQAHEEDTEQAVRAGLAIVEAVGRLALPHRLEVRLGIATGLVIVGDLIGLGAAQEQAVVGETPNLAARLQALAEPNTVVIAAATRRQIGDLFELRDLGPQALKGFAGASEAWKVLGESEVASRFEALRSRATPLIGREEELELLLRRWQQAKAGEGRVVLLSAEAGIGKSRLAEALRERIAGEPHRRLRYFCSPHHSESALYPIIGQLERAAGFARDDTPAAKWRKLTVLFADDGSTDDLALLADLLSLAAGPGTAVGLTPQQKKERTFEALMRLLDDLARQRPVLMVFEDLHWMDPTSRELLDRAIARVERLPVLLIASFRPDFQPSWTGLPHVTMLALNRLGRRDGATLVERIAGTAALPADLIAEVVERTDGVPLFLEEVTKALLETAGGADGATARGIIAGIPGERVAVPPTLQASLLARLDRLGPAAREIAQTGAAIGRDFSYELLAAVAGSGDAETRAALGQLVAAGLLFQRGTPPAADYQFKHALVQDTAYGTLLRSPRQALHGRIAAAIETHLPDRVDREPEILAFHLGEAGQTESAAVHWRKAARPNRLRSF